VIVILCLLSDWGIVICMRVQIRLKTIRNIIFGLILLVMGGGVGYYYGKGDLRVQADKRLPQVLINTDKPEDFTEVDFSLFWDVWRELEKEYLDPEKLDSEQMVFGAIEGMVSALGDPYTVFLPPVDQQRAEEDLSGAFEGVGIQLGMKEKQLAVIAPLKGMPAEAAGVEAGDWILHIKDSSKDLDMDTTGVSPAEAVSLIRGKHGVPVTLTLFREDRVPLEPFDVTIERDTIVVPSVELEFVENQEGGQVAHLTLSRFGGRTEDEWNAAVDEILQKGVGKVVLDMRNNPGGYLNGAIFIASEFIDRGVVVKQQGRYKTETFSVNRVGRLVDHDVVVLVNKGSASASEIVAGALRDRTESPLVGEKTFGKGTVQNAAEFRDGTGIHITIARWLLPGGDWIHEDGIPVDIEASNSAETVDVDEMLEAAVEAFE
jgi:carboxyl-terminal processing protease